MTTTAATAVTTTTTGSATTATTKATATATASSSGGKKATTAAVADLCTALRSYCALLTLARPESGILGPVRLKAALFVSLEAFRRVTAAAAADAAKFVPLALPNRNFPPPVSGDGARGGVLSSVATTAVGEVEAVAMAAARAAVVRLEEVILCAILVTAGRVGTEDYFFSLDMPTLVPLGLAGKVASMGGGMGSGKKGSGGGGGGSGGRVVAGEKTTAAASAAPDGVGVATAAAAVDPEEGIKLCAAALRDLVVSTGSPSSGRIRSSGNATGTVAVIVTGTHGSNGIEEAIPAFGDETKAIEVAGFDSDGVNGGNDSVEGGGGGCCCCAGLYAALLLRGSNFDALSEVVGGGLGTPPPLGGSDGIGKSGEPVLYFLLYFVF